MYSVRCETISPCLHEEVLGKHKTFKMHQPVLCWLLLLLLLMHHSLWTLHLVFSCPAPSLLQNWSLLWHNIEQLQRWLQLQNNTDTCEKVGADMRLAWITASTQCKLAKLINKMGISDDNSQFTWTVLWPDPQTKAQRTSFKDSIQKQWTRQV